MKLDRLNHVAVATLPIDQSIALDSGQLPAEKMIRIVAGVAMAEDGRTLLVRKRGTSAFMQPGGKLMSGEAPAAALQREIREELGCAILPGALRELGTFQAPAANEPGFTVEARLFTVALVGEPRAQAEIEELIWVDPDSLDGLTLAPLARLHALPLARELKGLRS
jgi:8-oxo-dGTP pyrophosphatase MutT (NUDIX family)